MILKRIYFLIAVFVCSVCVVFCLQLLANYRYNKPNSFVRLKPPFKITAKDVKDLKNKDMYLAGENGGFIYLGNKKIKNIVLKVNLSNLTTSLKVIPVEKKFKVLEDANIRVNDSNLYLFDGGGSFVNWGGLSDLSIKHKLKTPYFTCGINISNNAFLFRSTDSGSKNVLVKQTIDPTSVLVKNNILKKQVDGFFCTDGVMLKVPNENKVVYLYYYRNQFLVMDTNLNMIYKGKTIDTNSIAKIKVKKIHSSNQTTFASPPLTVNIRASASKDYLFVQSSLKADNDIDETYKNSAVIDVYELKNGKYKFSFYLPNFAYEKLVDFGVYEDTLVALFGHYLYSFKINF